MKGQPVFFLARICDRFGNPFLTPDILSAYNVGDLKLSARIRNYGDTRVLNLTTGFLWNTITVSAYDTLNRGLIK